MAYVKTPAPTPRVIDWKTLVRRISGPPPAYEVTYVFSNGREFKQLRDDTGEPS